MISAGNIGHQVRVHRIHHDLGNRKADRRSHRDQTRHDQAVYQKIRREYDRHLWYGKIVIAVLHLYRNTPLAESDHRTDEPG